MHARRVHLSPEAHAAADGAMVRLLLLHLALWFLQRALGPIA
jgi:hypothetical protein